MGHDEPMSVHLVGSCQTVLVLHSYVQELRLGGEKNEVEMRWEIKCGQCNFVVISAVNMNKGGEEMA